MREQQIHFVNCVALEEVVLFFIGCTFYLSVIFQLQILGILTPDWRAFEVSQMSHSDRLKHLPLTSIHPDSTPEPPRLLSLATYRAWRPWGAALYFGVQPFAILKTQWCSAEGELSVLPPLLFLLLVGVVQYYVSCRKQRERTWLVSGSFFSV